MTGDGYKERLLQALSAKGWNQSDLARALKVTPQAVSQVIQGDRPGRKRLEEIAAVLGVSVLWLTTGADAPSWTLKTGSPRVEYIAGEPPQLVGVVTAGDGDLSDYVEQDPTPIPIPSSWKLVRVEGMSAYPAVYPKQLVFVDTDRATNPAMMTDAERVDLHDNMVVCQVQREGERVRGFLKRFCHAPGAPGDFILASVDGGRSSPFIPPADIFLITPVVGVLYQDPTKPRQKMHHAKTVIVETPEA